jgi:branched-chain amino acid aminotransferase
VAAWRCLNVLSRSRSLSSNLSLCQAFGAGTAAIVSPVEGFHFQGTDYKIPLNPKDATAKVCCPENLTIHPAHTHVQPTSRPYIPRSFISPRTHTPPTFPAVYQAGVLTQRIADTIMGIQYGKIPHKWSVPVKDL